MPLRTILGLALLLAAQPAHAEEGILDTLFGSRSGATPPNPFASNYPSAPPAPAVRDERERRAARGTSAAPDAGPVPPGRIPE